MLLTVDGAFARQVEHMLLDDFALSLEITEADIKATHRLQQLGMRVARLVSPVL